MNIAMCIPTYNRAEVVEDTLSRGIEHYVKHGIDVYYYDGSPNDDTRKVVQKYIDKGYDNIKYLSYPNPDDNRIGLMYTGTGFDKEYDYMWPVKDRVWFEEPTIVEVKKAMEGGYDAIFLGVLPCIAHPNIGTKSYDNPQEFYLDWGYLVTSIDVNIYKRESMLSELSFEDIVSYNYAYPHFEIMFRGLARENRRVKALVGEHIVAYNSKLASSGWKKDAFSIWVDKWIDVNEKLPKCYDKYKATVIKHAGTLPWIFGGVMPLLSFKESGAFENIDMNELLSKWHRVSDVPKEKLIAIAEGTYDIKHDIDIIPNNIDAALDVFIEMAQYIRDGKLSKEKIPFEDIVSCILGKIQKRYKNKMRYAYILLGSIEDIVNYMIRGTKTKEEMDKAVQLLLAITMLALPDESL